MLSKSSYLYEICDSLFPARSYADVFVVFPSLSYSYAVFAPHLSVTDVTLEVSASTVYSVSLPLASVSLIRSFPELGSPQQQSLYPKERYMVPYVPFLNVVSVRGLP